MVVNPVVVASTGLAHQQAVVKETVLVEPGLRYVTVLLRSRCEEEQIMFVDITGISRGLGDGQGALAPDNLHPSGHQYREWMRAAYPVARAIIY